MKEKISKGGERHRREISRTVKIILYYNHVISLYVCIFPIPYLYHTRTRCAICTMNNKCLIEQECLNISTFISICLLFLNVTLSPYLKNLQN